MPETPDPTHEPNFEGDFDEERAKRAIGSLREEVATLKASLETVSAERDEFKSAAEKTGTERDEALAKAVERAEKAERDLAIKKHDLPDDVVEEFADYLTGTAEEVDAKAARLAKRLAPAKEQEPEDNGDEGGDEGEEPAGDGEPAPATPSARPRPALTPGHGGEPSVEFDPDAIAKAARR